MTVTYTGEVATSDFLCFLKLLLKWRGSIYKLLWKDFLIFATLYYFLAALYNFLLNEGQKRIFEKISRYCDANSNLIPVAFVLGFFVNLVVSRWWKQVTKIPYPDRMAMFVTANIRGQDERGRLMRRTIMRYMCLSYVIMMSCISPTIKKRFPTFKHMTTAGFMLDNEEEIMTKIKTNYNKFFVPLVWTTSLIQRARREGRISDDFAVKTLNDEVNEFRGKLASLYLFDWIPVPLVYTQVVTVAVHTFSMSCLMGRQFSDSGPDGMKFYFPFFTFLQYLFYMGWLKVAECLLNPFGEDDEDVDVNALVDRNLQVSYLIVDEMHDEHPELIRDQYWDEVQFDIPYTDASAPFRRESFLGSAMKLHFKEFEAELQRRTSKSTRRNSTATEASIQVTIDHHHQRFGSARLKHKSSIDSSDTEGKITPFQRQESFCGDEIFKFKADGDVEKCGVLKVENQEMKVKLEGVKKALEPLIESDEPLYLYSNRNESSHETEKF